jgi:hypothetical protein
MAAAKGEETMRHRRYRALAALAIGMCLPAIAAAPQRRTVAIMPTQYFSADAQSADRVTTGLVDQFRGHGYAVIPMERARATFAAMKLDPSRHYGDAVALQFGRRIGSDLVAYPSLLALGTPATGSNTPPEATSLGAVVHLRVLNPRTGKTIYTRQIRHRFEVADTGDARVTLPTADADAAAREVTSNYFERIAGSREEIGRRR